MVKVLMIEDDEEFAGLIAEFLKRYDIEVTNYHDPYLGLSCGIKNFDLMILDLGLPGMDGFEVCKKVSEKYEIPIIISSARSQLSDKIVGLQLGADDYLPKPYDPNELYARIVSILRRTKKLEKLGAKSQSEFELKPNEHAVYLKGIELSLTPAEYEIMEYLIKNHGMSVSREQLLNSISQIRAQEGKSLDMMISKLRQKMQDVSSAKHLVTLRGIGYKLIG